jgi:DNA-binding NtrC family response regulator
MCRNGRGALEALRTMPYDVALIDIVMPEMDGLEVLRHLQSEAAPPEVIIITGNGTIDTAITAIKLGAYDYISKPYRMAEIDVMVRRAWEKRELCNANILLRRSAPALPCTVPASSAPMRALMAQVHTVSATAEPVVLVGERGAGKSRLARYIHAQSGRMRDALVELTGGSGARYDVESLVGREGGCAPGALRAGAFLAAQRGTLVIDAESLDADARAVLRAALRDGVFTRVGGERAIPLTARVIVTARPTPEGQAAVAELPAARIAVPPLRDRGDDLEALSAELLATIPAPARELAPDALDVLRGYSWPGNVGELRVVLERAALLAAAERIGGAELRVLLAAGRADIGSGAETGGALSQLERLHIEAMLVRCNWHQGRAAAALGISTKTLYRKMREYGFQRPRKRKLARVRAET